MSINKVDYEVLSSAATVYANQATALDQIITTLGSTNGELADGWTNATATAFLERYEAEYKVQLQNIRDAVQSISEFINTYVTNKINQDNEEASGVRGA